MERYSNQYNLLYKQIKECDQSTTIEELKENMLKEGYDGEKPVLLAYETDKNQFYVIDGTHRFIAYFSLEDGTKRKSASPVNSVFVEISNIYESLKKFHHVILTRE